MKSRYQILILVATAVSFAGPAEADDARLKETLRTLTLRLRSAETERNTLLSDKAQLEQEKKTLTTKLDASSKEAATAKEQLATLTSKSESQEKELNEAKESFGKWKDSYEKLTAAAQKSEAERTKLASETIILQRKLDDRERKNLELFRLGNEILTRYEKFGLGDALAAREPFTGIARVKLENLVQDYQDKLADQRVNK